MSVHCLSWVFKHSPAKGGDRLVLLVLADHAKDDGTFAWPAKQTIADEARMDRRSAQRCLRRLEEAGQVIERGVSKSGTTIYDVVMVGGGVLPPAASGAAGGDRVPPEPSLTVRSSPDGEDAALLPTAIEQVYEHWRSAFGLNGNVTLTPERRKRVRDRLQKKTVEQLCRAVDGCAGDPWRHEGPLSRRDLELICRTDTKVEQFMAMPSKALQEEELSESARSRRAAYERMEGEA